VVAHVHTCRYWPPGAGTARPPSTVGPHNALAEAAAD